MSDRQIGILDGFVFGVGLIAEVPSGALADLLGRKNQLKLGLVMMSIGFLAQGFAQEYIHILLGMLFFTVGMAFVSGSDDALVYDSLDSEKLSGKWEKVIARKYQVMVTVTILSYVIGGLLYAAHFRLPFILSGVGFLIAFFVASSMKEVEVIKMKLSGRNYIEQNLDGMKFLLRRSLWLYAFMALIILGAGYAFELGIIKPLILDSLGYKENAQAVINAIAGIALVIALSQLSRLRRILGEKTGLIVLAFLMAFGFFAVSFPIGIFGIIAFVMIFIVNGMVAPWLNNVVQKETPSSHRATTLSTLALLQKLPYVLLAPVAGGLSTNGKFSLFLLGISIVIFLAVCAVLLFGVFNKRFQQRLLRNTAPKN